MGTTAEKLNYLKETKTEIKNALETPSNIFRDYPNLIKKYIDNQPTKVVSDGVCGNALDLPAKLIEVEGNSEQKIYEGYNLFNNNSQNFPATIPGLEINFRDDGSISAKGTATSTWNRKRSNGNIYNIEAGTYTLYLKVNGSCPNAILSIALEDADMKTITSGRVGVSNSSLIKVVTFTCDVTTEIKYTSITLEGIKTNIAYNCTFYPMLLTGAYTTDVEYEPYTGGTPSPNPEYPQEITNVGENGIKIKQSGKNLFDNTLKGYGNYGVIAKTIPTGVRLSAATDVTASNYFFGVYATINLSNFVGKTVRMKAMFKSNSNLKGTYSIGLCDSNGANRAPKDDTSTSGKEISFVVPNLETGQEYLGVWFYANSGGTGVAGDYVDYTNVIITIDNEDMTYEPYHEPKVIEINLNGNTLAKVGDVKDILKVNRNGEVEIKKNTWEETINGSDLITLSNNNKGLVFTTSKKKVTGEGTNNYLVTNAQRNRTYNDGTVYQNSLNFVFVGSSTDTLETIKAKFNGGKILYQLATPQIITLPSISPIELWQGTNIFKLITNLDTTFEVEYIVNKDSVLNEVQTAMLEAEIEI